MGGWCTDGQWSGPYSVRRRNPFVGKETSVDLTGTVSCVSLPCLLLTHKFQTSGDPSPVTVVDGSDGPVPFKSRC